MRGDMAKKNKRCQQCHRAPITHQAYLPNCGKDQDTGCDFDVSVPGHKRTRHYCDYVCVECARIARETGWGTVRIKNTSAAKFQK